jgi:hypothetical protein
MTHLFRSTWRPGLTLLGLLQLWSCSVTTIDRHAANQPALVPEEFFSGALTAHGVIKNRGGEVISYFNADICASWTAEGTGTLDEKFVFNDGKSQSRIWTLKPSGSQTYLASANDTLGISSAQVSGNALFMDYVLQISYRERPLAVTVRDRMYLVNGDTIINESTLHKWGFQVGSVILTIRKSATNGC